MQTEDEKQNFLATPCTNAGRRNLLEIFHNSEDSGFFSNTPGSKESSYKSINESSSNGKWMTPVSSVVSSTPGLFCNCYGEYFPTSVENVRQSGTGKIDSSFTLYPEYCACNGPSPIYDTKRKDKLSFCIEDSEEPSFQANACSTAEKHHNQGRWDFSDDELQHETNLSRQESMEVSLGGDISSFNEDDNDVFMECDEELHAAAIMETKPVTRIVKENMEFFPISSRLETQITPQKKTERFSRTEERSSIGNKKPILLSRKLPNRKSLYGFEYVDILYFLGEKQNFSTTVSKILSYLSIRDLKNVLSVSKTWRQICMNDSKSRKRLLHHKNHYRGKENSAKGNKSKKDTNRPYLMDINNIQEPSPTKVLSPVCSPRSHRFKLFFEEGQKLEGKRKLMPCPRCTLPARCECTSDNLGKCQSCQYRFCTSCLGEYHYPKRCVRISSCPRSHRQNSINSILIGSKASKRRLSRT